MIIQPPFHEGIMHSQATLPMDVGSARHAVEALDVAVQRVSARCSRVSAGPQAQYLLQYLLVL